jgi:hypothetical protein
MTLRQPPYTNSASSRGYELDEYDRHDYVQK